jgi:hypothetical protein
MPEVPLKKLWVSHPKFTGQVCVDEDDIIRQAPPVWLRFIGQNICRLKFWLQGLGPGMKISRL